MKDISFHPDGQRQQPKGLEQSSKNRLRRLGHLLDDIATINSMMDSSEREALIHEIDRDNHLFNMLSERFHIRKKAVMNVLKNRGSIDDILTADTIKDIGKYISNLFWPPNTAFDNASQDPAHRWGSQGSGAAGHPPKVLFEVTGRHIVFIMHAFKGLQQLSADNQQNMIDSFLKQMMITQQWLEIKDKNKALFKHTFDGKEFNITRFYQLIQDSVKIQLTDKKYCVKNSEMYDELVAKKTLFSIQ